MKRPVKYDPCTVIAVALIAGSQPLESKTYEEAIKDVNSTQQKKAMNEEMESMKKHEVWDLSEIPADRKALKK